jgi:dihydrolipoamide dehydrogenase
MAAERFDLVVVGGGPGGYTGAIRAAQLGMRVACVEKAPALGGTCLSDRLHPSKALLDSSELYAQATKSLAATASRSADVELDLPAMMARKDEVVTGLTQGVAGLFKKNKIEWVAGAGRLAARGARGPARRAERTLEAARIMIATGSEVMPLKTLPLDGKRIVSSTEALSLPRCRSACWSSAPAPSASSSGSVWSRLGAE